MITQDFRNAIDFATVAETQELNDLIHDDLYGFINKLESIAKRMLQQDEQQLHYDTALAFDSMFLGTTPSDLKALARRATIRSVK